MYPKIHKLLSPLHQFIQCGFLHVCHELVAQPNSILAPLSSSSTWKGTPPALLFLSQRS